MSRVLLLACAVLVASLAGAVGAQQRDAFRIVRDHPAINYSTQQPRDAIVRLNERIQRGDVDLAHEGSPRGYLKSILAALDIPVSSQVLVFSENSLQGEHISPKTPRAIYFNDTVAIGWANGAETVEATAVDPAQGVHFYSLVQRKAARPQFARRNDCLQCHLMPHMAGVPGLFAMSVLPLSDNKHEYAQGWATDHRTPMEDRWGGWYVTGTRVPARHLGNVPVMHVPKSYVRAEVAPALKTAAAAFDSSPYLTSHSDVVALLVLNHQVHATNLMIQLGWTARIAAHDAERSRSHARALAEAANELADYMLFLDEAPFPSPIHGSTSFANDFAAKGPRDAQGRSLRDFDLTRRLFRYPLSYMIYTDVFDALPSPAKAAVYERLWDVLSGASAGAAGSRLPIADRRTIVEILRATKHDLPDGRFVLAHFMQ